MKVRFGALMMTLLLLLTSGCGQANDSEDKSEELRKQLSQIAACEIECSMTADYGQAGYDFKLSFSYDSDGESILTVIEPENISGLQIALNGETLELLFSQTRLETGTLTSNGLTPVTAIPMMLSAWKNGYVYSIGNEEVDEVGCLFLSIKTMDGDEDLSYNLWVGEESFIPRKAEIIYQGNTVIGCQFSRFEVTEIKEENYDGTGNENMG